MKDETKIIITAIIAIALLESFALWRGLDGALFGLVVAIISGLAGYEIKTALTQIKR